MKSFTLRLLVLLVSLCSSGFADAPASHPFMTEWKHIDYHGYMKNVNARSHSLIANKVGSGADIKPMKVEKWAAGQGTDISLPGAELHIPAGAMLSPALVSVTALQEFDIPVLDPGLVNVTDVYAGYRFLPHGSLFKKPVTLDLGYDETKIPIGYTAKDVTTFFFDESKKHWVPLPKESVDEINKKIISTTKHFTDMINGIIEVPESAGPLALTPNSMSGTEMEHATSQIVTIDAPTASQAGSAVLDFPIKLPAGRRGMQPQLGVQYNSDGGDGWAGLGWDMPTPSVTIETRWGVPRYDAVLETETYVINGAQLSPVAHRSAAIARTPEKQFYPRVNTDFQKTIRHGNSPASYWWEITDKSGVRRFYGGEPGNGIDPAAVLTDSIGNIGYWALTEEIDPNQNFVKYRYAKVIDPGNLLGNTGSNIYPASITYTGNGTTEGKYTVLFTRDRDLNEAKRKDVTINGRLGFKQVTADLLRKIAVQYNGQNVRSYELNYAEGAFYKSLLQNIKEFDAAGNLFTTHSLEYYNDVQGAGGVYQPLAGPQDWNPQADTVKGTFLNPIPLFNDAATALSGNKSIGGSVGVAITIGPDDDDLALKTNTAGITLGFDISGNEGMLALIDINGDGLPDKLFKKGGQLYYRANQSALNNSVEFGPLKQISGVSDFNKGLTFGVDIGLESNFVIYAGFKYSHIEDINTVYMEDVNSDGLMDIVSHGTVYFNHLDADGNPTFTPSSSLTPSPIKNSSAIDGGLVQNDPQALQKAIDANPLHDVVKVWVAPFDGTVDINAPVSLIQDLSDDAKAYTAADGVRVAIQHQGTEVWSTTINANDFTAKVPTGVNAVPVKKGDHIYFRVQSIFNGAYDQVHWIPQITYSNNLAGLNDANSLPIYQFQSNKDFLMSAAYSTAMPIPGTIHVQGDFTKPVTSDDVTISLLKKTPDPSDKTKFITNTLLQQHFTADQVVDFPVAIDENVLQGENLLFSVSSPTNVDWTALHWNPKVYYTASTDPKTPTVIDVKGNPLVQIYPTVDFQSFTKDIVPSLPWTATSTDTFSIQAKPKLNLNFLNGQVVFSIKKEKQLLAEQTLVVNNGVIEAHPALSAKFNSGDMVFFEYHTADTVVAFAFDSTTVIAKPNHGKADTLLAGLHTRDNSFIFGPMYRHWGQFAYNGNRDRANEPIIESDLHLNPTLVKPLKPIDLSSLADTSNPAGSMDQMQQAYNTQGGYQPVNDNFIYLVPNSQRQAYIGYDNLTFVTSDTISSSRLGKDDLLPYNPITVSTAGSGTGAVGISKVASTDDVALGVNALSGEIGIGASIGTTKFAYDFTDMNGDGYPDILSASKIQYTTPYGGLETSAKNFGFGDVTLSNHSSIGGTAGGSLALSSSPNSSQAPKGAKAAAAETESEGSAGIGVQFGANFDQDQTGFIDVNGDGLPDRVHTDGRVELNLGYSFMQPEQWGYGDFGGLSGGKAINYGGGISINIDDYSIAAGVSLTRMQNLGNKTLLDVNGDGLPDYIQSISPLVVRLNTGNSFGPPVTWTGADNFNQGVSTGESINIAFTIGISILPILPIVKLCVNPSIAISQGADRTEVQFGDIDGDGFPDYLQSTVDSKLTVSRSTIQRTNKLKKVSRPLGGSFVLNYARIGNTYNMPNSVWTLSRVDLYDGVPGDGPTFTSKSFEYQLGKFERNEREFYGFGKVITKDLDTDHGDAVYRTVEDDYLTDNYYDKGLLAYEVLKDAAGNKFTETTNTYQLKDISNGTALAANFQSDEGAAFPALVTAQQAFYEGQPAAGKTTSKTYTYDLLGNISSTTDFGDPGPADDLTTVTSYNTISAKYIMNIPGSVTVSGSGKVYRQRANSIDNNNGNITQTKLFLASGDVATYDMVYDTYGNIVSLTRPENAAHQRLTYTYQYDAAVQTYLAKTTDSYGYSSSATYDVRFGEELSYTDINGQQTQHTLDNAGRVLTMRGPLEIASNQPFTISFEYHPEAVVPWAYSKHFDPAHPANFIELAAFSDGLGREVQTKRDIALFTDAQSPDHEVMVVSGSTTFDPFGRPVVQYYPLTEEKGATIGVYNPNADIVTPELITYDVMDRPLVTTLPDLAVRKMTYGFGTDRDGNTQFKTDSVDANGISMQRFLNVRNLLTATKHQYSQGNDVWTSYNYDPMNQLTKVTDDLGKVTTMAYDQLGRTTSDTHPDAGTTNYKYDLVGNLSSKITANLQGAGAGIKYTYDRERLTNITYPVNPQNNVTIAYGAPGATFFRAGRMISQKDGSGTQQFFYDPLGAIIKNIRVINVPNAATLTFTTQWTYDTWNRLTTMIYPDGEQLTYNYNLGGSLLTMSGVNNGASYNYLTKLGYDKFEQRVFMQYGNGTAMTYTFGAQRLELAHTTAKTRAGRFMMDNTLTWDNENEILNIVNAAPVPPSNLMGGSAAYQYAYDDLYRLTSANGSFSGSSHVDSFNLAMTYNTVSAITGKTQVHQTRGSNNQNWVLQKQSSYNYIYVYNPAQQPHAPVHIGTDAYTYDANGNQLSSQDDVSAQNRQIIWDEEDRINTLSDNGQQFNYTYDAGGTRVLKSIGNGQTVSVNGKQAAKTTGTGNYTIYVNPYEEVTSGGYTKHFYVAGQRIVSKLGASGNGGSTKDWQQFYYHPDHLGNSAYITDASGEVYQHLEYYPFGETFIDEHGNQQNTPYLYNGKELDDETGLYYYGGRYYDPVTNVWPSVDPSWEAPDQLGQSPYAYVGNNPVTFVDPDGRYKYFTQGGLFNSDILRLVAPPLPKMLGWIAKNNNGENLGTLSLTQRNNPNSIAQAIETISSLTNYNGGGNITPPAAAPKAKKTGKKYYLTLSVLDIKLLSSAPPEKSRKEKEAEKRKRYIQKLNNAAAKGALPAVISAFARMQKRR